MFGFYDLGNNSRRKLVPMVPMARTYETFPWKLCFTGQSNKTVVECLIILDVITSDTCCHILL